MDTPSSDANRRAHRPPVVLVMLKAPREGTVKTRLAAEVGAAQATRVYRLLVERQMAAIPPGWPVEVHFAPTDARGEMRDWLGPRPALHPQAAGDLGQRLTQAVDGAFRRGAPAVLVIGGDCPGLDNGVLLAAAGALGPREVVLGPAGDGGYYLIGLSQPLPRLFSDIPWSTGEVFNVTLRQIDDCRLTPVLLGVRDDVDTLADLQRHATGLLGPDAPTFA